MDANSKRLEVINSYGGRTAGSIFSHDSSLLLVWGSRNVRVLSASTGETVRTLEWEVAHTGRITCLALHPLVNTQVYASSTAGCIALWDYTSGAIVKTIPVGPPLHWLSVDPEGGRKAFVLCSQSEKDDEKPGAQRKGALWKLLYVYLKGSNRKPLSFPFRIRGPPGRLPLLSLGCNQQKLAAAYGKSIEVFDLATRTSKSISAHQPVSAIAMHPSTAQLAVADKRGQITLSGVGGSEDQASVQSKFHWHANAIGALVFTPDGRDLLSGGQEGVVVVWNVESRSRHFFPRLGQIITSLSTSQDSKLFAVATSENDVYILDTVTSSLQAAVRGLFLDPSMQGCFTSLVCRNQSVYIPHPSGNMVVHDMSTHSCHPILKPSGVASIGKRRGATASVQPVSRVDVSHDGKWIAVAESRLPGCGGVIQASLKLWEHHLESSTYSLKAQTPLAVGEDITSLAFSPNGEQLMSASSTKHIKFWSRSSKQGESAWICESVGYFQDALVLDASFSADSSLLLLGCEKALVLWDPHSNCMLKVVAILDEPIRQVSFVGTTASAAVLTSSTMYLFDARSCTLLWSVRVPEAILMCNTQSNKLVLSLENGDSSVVACFSTSSPVPEAAVPTKNTGRVIGGALLNNDFIILATDDHELISLGYKAAAKDSLANTGPAQSKSGVTSLFPSMVIARAKAISATTIPQHQVPESLALQLLDSPSHALPGPSHLCDLFLASLLPRSVSSI